MKFTVAFSLLYLFDWKFADLMYFVLHKAEYAYPENCLSGFAWPSIEGASNWHLARHLPRPVVSRSCPKTEVVLKNSKSLEGNTGVSVWLQKSPQHKCYCVNLVTFCRVLVNSFWVFKHPSRKTFYSSWHGFENL